MSSLDLMSRYTPMQKVICLLVGVLFLPSSYAYHHRDTSVAKIGIPEQGYFVGNIKTKDKKGVFVRACASTKCEIVGSLKDGGPYFFHKDVQGDWAIYGNNFVHKDFIEIIHGEPNFIKEKPRRYTSFQYVKESVEEAIKILSLSKNPNQISFAEKDLLFTDDKQLSYSYSLKIKNEKFKGTRQMLSPDQFVDILIGQTNTYCRLQRGSNTSTVIFDNKTNKTLEASTDGGLPIWDLWDLKGAFVGKDVFKSCIVHDGFYFDAKSLGNYNLKMGVHRIQKKSLSRINNEQELTVIKDQRHILRVVPPEYRSTNLTGIREIKSLRAYPEYFFYYKNSDEKKSMKFDLGHLDLAVSGKEFTIRLHIEKGLGQRFQIHALANLNVNGFLVKKNETIKQEDLMNLLHAQKQFTSLKADQHLGFVRTAYEEEMGDHTVYFKFPRGLKIGSFYELNDFYHKAIQDETGQISIFRRKITPEDVETVYSRSGKFVQTDIRLDGAQKRVDARNRYIDAYECNDDYKFLNLFSGYLLRQQITPNDVKEIRKKNSRIYVTLNKNKNFLDVKMNKDSTIVLFWPTCSEDIIIDRVILAGAGEWDRKLLKDKDLIFFEEDHVSLILRGNKTFYSKTKLDIEYNVKNMKNSIYHLCSLIEIPQGKNDLGIPTCEAFEVTPQLHSKVYSIRMDDKKFLVASYRGANRQLAYYEYDADIIRTPNTLILGGNEHYLPTVYPVGAKKWSEIVDMMKKGRKVTYHFDDRIRLSNQIDMCSKLPSKPGDAVILNDSENTSYQIKYYLWARNKNFCSK